MKLFTFTIDDNIRFLRELTAAREKELFAHPYTAMLARLHERFGIKIQLNMFYREGDFSLSDVPDDYRAAFEGTSDWLKLSFHSAEEFPKQPYLDAPGEKLGSDCNAVQNEIIRFAGEKSLAKTTTVHYCTCTPEGLDALRTAGVRGLLGLFGTPEKPRTSYCLTEAEAAGIRMGRPLKKDGLLYAAINEILNTRTSGQIPECVGRLASLERASLMIHEQYFYPDYRAYQPDFEQKLTTAFGIMTDAGYASTFLEDWPEFA